MVSLGQASAGDCEGGCQDTRAALLEQIAGDLVRMQILIPRDGDGGRGGAPRSAFLMSSQPILPVQESHFEWQPARQALHAHEIIKH